MRNQFWSICGLAAILSLFSAAASTVWAGTSSSFATSNAPPSTNMVPGQTFVVTVTAQTSDILGINYNQIALSPNLGGQFQIVGGSCNTTAAYVNNATCTVDIKFLGNSPSSFTADLMMQCSSVLGAAGGYAVICGNGVPGASARMARVLGNGIAAAVDALGREGLTLLAALMFALTAVVTLKRRT